MVLQRLRKAKLCDIKAGAAWVCIEHLAGDAGAKFTDQVGPKRDGITKHGCARVDSAVPGEPFVPSPGYAVVTPGVDCGLSCLPPVKKKWCLPTLWSIRKNSFQASLLRVIFLTKFCD